MAAGVHYAVDGGGERESGVLLEGQGVEVGAQRHAAIAESDVADQAGTAGKGAGLEAGGHQPLGYELCGAQLGPAELGYRVERSTPAHDIGAVCVEPGVEPGWTGTRAEVGNDEVGDGEVGVRLQEGHRAPPARPTLGRCATARCVSGPRIEAALTCISQSCSPGQR